jgi:CelD/BcsL family acetyltransferase involved in cellulose biosynthesis
MTAIPLSVTQTQIDAAGAALTVKRVSEAQFTAMATEWNALLAASQRSSVFMRWEWMHTWWELFKHRKTLCILAARENGTLVGLAPFYIERQPPLNARMLKFCSAEDLYPDYLDIIADPHVEQGVGQAFMRYLSDQRVLDGMVLDNVLQDSIVQRYFLPAGTQFRTFVRLSSTCPYIRFGGRFDDYMKARFSGKKRRQLNWQLRQALEEHGMTLVAPSSHTEAVAAVEHVFDLHERRAAEKQIASSFATDKAMAFHRKLTASFFASGILDLRLLLKGNEPVGASYNFIYQDKVYHFQSGFDPQWEKLSLGTSLTLLMVRSTADRGLAEYDFLKGDERYKKSWATGEHQQYEIRVFLRTSRGWLAENLYRSKLAVKNLARRLRTDTPE